MDLSIPPPVSGSSRGGSGGKGEAISPFVQKMMAMEKSGEMITTKSIQQHAMSAPPPSRFNMMPPGESGHVGIEQHNNTQGTGEFGIYEMVLNMM